MSTSTPLQRTSAAFRGGAQDHGSSQGAAGRYKDPFTQARMARFRTAREQDKLATAFDDLEAWADGLLTAAGSADLCKADDRSHWDGTASTSTSYEDSAYAAHLRERMDMRAAIDGDTEALERVKQRARDWAATEYYPTLAELGVDTTPPLRRPTIIDPIDPHDHFAANADFVGFHVVTRP